MPTARQISTLVTSTTSDAFGILIHDTPSPSWSAAAKLVCGGSIPRCSHVFVTSGDGERREQVALADFFGIAHEQGELTISADWLVDGAMEGFLVAHFKCERGISIEQYEFGMLGRFESTFIDLLFSRACELAEEHKTLFAIDEEGRSSIAEWIEVFSTGANTPSTASVVAGSPGIIVAAVPTLSRTYDLDDIRVHCRE